MLEYSKDFMRWKHCLQTSSKNLHHIGYYLPVQSIVDSIFSESFTMASNDAIQTDPSEAQRSAKTAGGRRLRAARSSIFPTSAPRFA